MPATKKTTIKKAPVVKKASKVAKKEPVINSEKKHSVGLTMAVFDQNGQTASNINLPLEIFGLKVNSDLVAQAVRAQLANSRDSIAHSKDRSEVRGGGKKPWKQKGTGRARHASIRSPLWPGGGVTFGPRKERNFSLNINKKMKRQALLMVLSGKAQDGEIVILEDLKLTQPKTKEMAIMLKQVAAGAKKELNRGALIVLPEKDEAVFRATRNLSKVSTIGINSLNVVDLLSIKYLLMPKAAVEKIESIYQKK